MLFKRRTRAIMPIAEKCDRKELATAWSAVIRGGRQAKGLLEKVPQDQRTNGYAFALARQLRREGAFVEAAAVLAKVPRDPAALVDPDAWWQERRVLSRELLDIGQYRLAYEIVAADSAQDPAAAADAAFHAGWYALRFLNEPKAAAAHFARVEEVSDGPISNARGWYWMARAAEAGGTGDAEALYRRAARYGTTFYGQLAADRLGLTAIDASEPQPGNALRAAFSAHPPVRAIARLEAAGYPGLARQMTMDLAGFLTGPGEVALLSARAQAAGDHYLALRIAKAAARRGMDVGALAHPVGVIPADADIAAAGKALAYAVARQESEFNVAAVSPAGARGLLQLMPRTARSVAGSAGLAYSGERLTTDPAYNATLGSAYLGQQLDRFGGSYILTFAGYNAGPSRAREWVSRFGDPRGKPVDFVVDWIERIPFPETRNYVQRVMENYQVYKQRLTGRFDIASDLRHGR